MDSRVPYAAPGSTVTMPAGWRAVDLADVTCADLETLWQREAHWWREQLLWDVSDTQAALRRVVQRRGVPGKAIQVEGRTLGYAYYGIVGPVGVIASLQVLPGPHSPLVGSMLLQETVAAMRQQGVARIESSGIVIDAPWLIPAFTQQGFQHYWREFLRIELRHPPAPLPAAAGIHLQPWQSASMHEAAAIMQAAYMDGAEVESNAFYHTTQGCRLVLEHILHQGGCGRPLAAASALARQQGRSVGFIVVTETASRQGHLVQVAVLPGHQHGGVGRRLLHYSMSQLAALHFETLSLIVSRTNHRALAMYRAAGLQPVLTFPVFVWRSQNSDS
jgi:ribosomal protein S18 acetylase RimI-like enzyme